MENTKADGKPAVAVTEYVPASEARDRLTELLNRARFSGERFVVTRNGDPLAVISGAQEFDLAPAR